MRRQGVDETGRTITLNVSLPAARFALAEGDVVTLEGFFEPQGFNVPERHFELRGEDGRLLFWYGEGIGKDGLVTPPEVNLGVGETFCSGAGCNGAWDLHSLGVSLGGETVTVAPGETTRVGDGWFQHTGHYEVVGPGDGTPCPTDFVFGGMSAAYYDASLAVADSGGVGGPCPYPVVGARGDIGELVCLGGLATPSGYLTAACETDDDCPGASRCDGAYCRAPCARDADCPPGLECTAAATSPNGESFSYCRCGAQCFEGRCDVAACPDDCPAGEWVTTFQEDALACLDDTQSCEPGYQRFDLAGCGCGCAPIPETECPLVPEEATFEYAPGGCSPDCDEGELRVETACGCGCTPDPSCPKYHPLDAEGPIYLGAPGECETLCDENTAPVDDDCGCFCHWAANILELCDVPPDPGPCVGEETRFFRNAYTGGCETFTYGGCLGNWNNFPTREACEAQCGR